MRIRAAFLSLMVAAALAVPAPASAAEASLASRIDPLLEGFPGGSAVWIADPVVPLAIYAHDPDREIVAASLYKLAILAAVEREVERGALRYEDTIVIEDADITADGSWVLPGALLTIDEALELMITVSDNGTAVHFWRTLGAERINDALVAMGVAGFHVALDVYDDHVVTPRAVGTFFSLLATRALVSGAASDRMTLRLERQRINDRIPAHLPAGTLVAHKTGDLVGLVHDAGIVFTERGARVIVAMTWDADEPSADALIAGVAAAVYEDTVAPVLAARFRIPAGPVYAESGATVSIPVQIRNEGTQPWTTNGEGLVGLVWDLRTASDALVARPVRPVPLGQVGPARTVARRVAVHVPDEAGDLALVLRLVDAAGRPLAPALATARIAVVVRSPAVDDGLGPAFSR